MCDELADLFLAHHYHLVCYLARSTGYDDDVANDLAADVWLKVAERLAAGHRIEWPKHYLMRSARNRQIDYHRRRRHRPDCLELTEQGPERSPVIADAFGYTEASDSEAVLLAACSPPQREVVTLRLTGHSNDEIAVQLTLQPGTVKARMQRARLKMRAAWQRMEQAP